MNEPLKRQRFRVALVGKKAVVHEELVRRAGYRVELAPDGAIAGRLFRQDTKPFDGLVVDFELDGRPPEAVLLFCRRTSPSAPVIALVPHEDESGFRRAFMAGARDVLPSPVRGEDLLDAIDLALEPRALSLLLEEVRAQGPFDIPSYNPDEEDALVQEIQRLQAELSKRNREQDNSQRFREQALRAVTERDAIEEEVQALKRELDRFKREHDKTNAEVRMHEQATRELHTRLKGTREAQRGAEHRAQSAERALNDLRVQTGQFPIIVDDDDDESTASIRSFNREEELDPERALDQRHREESLLAELDRALEEKARLEQKLLGFEEVTHASVTNAKANDDEATEIAKPSERSGLPAELDRVVRQRDFLGARVLELEAALSEAPEYNQEPDEKDERLRALLRQRDAAEEQLKRMADLEMRYREAQKEREETLTQYDEILRARDHLRKHLEKTEVELADALVKIEELEDLAQESETLKANLRTERTAREQLKKRWMALQHAHKRLQRLENASDDENESQKRQLVMAIARGEALASELASAKIDLKNARAMLRANLRPSDGGSDV